MHRERDGRTLDLHFDADGGGMLVNEGDISAQSVVLTSRELRWLFRRAPLVLWRSWWLKDGGGSDRFTAALSRLGAGGEEA